MNDFEDSSNKVDDYLKQLLPQIEKLSLDEIPFDSTFIGAAGFEDRCFSFINQVQILNKKFNNAIGIEYRPLNSKNRLKDFKKKLKKNALENTWLIYNRFEPEEFNKDFLKIKRDIWETANVVIDISGMSKFLIIVILNLFEDYSGNVHIIYSEPSVYRPTKKEFEDIKQKTLSEAKPSFLTEYVHKIITTPTLSSIAMSGYPLVIIAFPTFNHKELIALLDEMTPQKLVKIEGIPPNPINSWRLDAIHWINSTINESYFFDIHEIIHKNATTFDYKELVKTLEKVYKNFRYTHKCVIAPTGSKLQTFGVFIFKQMHPETQIVYPVTKKFAEEYSNGHGDIWHIPIFNFFGFMNELNQHRKYKVTSLKSRIKNNQKDPKYILHISDIHLGNSSEALKYRTQLETDLIKNLGVQKLDYLVISGDIANFSTREEYNAATELIKEIVTRFRLDSNCIIIVPGNHDINWSLSGDAYKFIKNNEIPEPLPEGKFIPAGDSGVLLRDEELYKQRFYNFNTFFYEKIIGTSYPLDYNNQGILYENSEDKIIFLGLNSCWEIDHHKPHNNRASINIEALSNVLTRLMDDKYDNWLKIAVWHHPVFGPEMMENDFMQQLADHGFQICMNGHIHEASENFYKYDDNRGIHIVEAGTFGAPKREQVSGIPLQYNLLVLDIEKSQIIVNTRKKEKPDGAWSADPRWVDKNNPKPRYKIDLS